MDALERLEAKVDDLASRLSRIEGALSSEAALTHESRLRTLEVSAAGMHTKLGLWGGTAGVLTLVGSFLREFLR